MSMLHILFLKSIYQIKSHIIDFAGKIYQSTVTHQPDFIY